MMTSMNKRNFKITLTVFLLIATGILLGQSDDSWKLYDDSQVAEIYITIDPEDLDWIYNNVHSDSLHPASFRFVNAWIDETVDSIGFRIRGNTSRVSAKKSFKVSFNTFVPGREFYGVDKMNLNGEHNDPSIVRSKLCWDIYQTIGMTASQAAHARVYINGEYYGLYISVEHIDDEFLEKNFSDDSGNLWKCLWPADLTYLGADPDLYKLYNGDRQVYELKTNEDQDDYSQLAHLIGILENTPDSQLADSLEKILAVPEVLKYLAINILTGSWDDYRFLKNNYYLYHNPAEDRFHFIPYDYDNTFSIDWFNIDWSSINPYSYAVNDNSGRPLTTRLLANDQYRNLFSHFLDFYRDNVFLLPLWEDRIDSLKSLIAPWAAIDSFRTMDYGFTMDDFNNSYSAGPYSDRHVKQGLKEFINQRNASLPGQLTWLTATPLVYDIDWSPRQPEPADTIIVYASIAGPLPIPSATIWFHPGNLTVIEEYPMDFEPVGGTKIAEEADRWVGKIPPLGVGGFGRFQIQAVDVNGMAGLYPRGPAIALQVGGQDTTGLVVNEFMADNDNVVMDEAGEYDDWLEIYNPTDQDIFLSGMYLTDNPDELTKWQFPFGGVALATGSYLLIWCDNDPEQGPLHATFKLSAGGEFIALVDVDGVTVIDSLSFGPQTTDVSFGRYPDGSDNWQIVAPTPGSANVVLLVVDEFQPSMFSVTAYPNPFNCSVTFRFDLPTAGEVSIAIFDLLGRQVMNNTADAVSGGQYQFVWDTGNCLAAGIYLYQVSFTSPSRLTPLMKTGKLIYLK